MKGAHTISYVNIGLMVLCAAVALYYPFEQFLLAVFILGPLHYLTEMSWLEKRGFFIKSKWNILFFVLLCILLTIPAIDKKSPLGPHQTNLMVSGFVYAVSILYFKEFWKSIVAFAITFLLGMAVSINTQYWVVILFAVLLPTIIHVMVFTGVFLLGGAVKNKTLPEFLSVGVFIACILFIILPQHSFGYYTVSPYLQKIYAPMAPLNKVLSDIFGMKVINSQSDVYAGNASFKIMSLIAFAYTYHYFNWFSKTTVIKWHQVSKTRLAGIAAVWIASLALCIYDIKTGFIVLSFMSLLHVAFEFPLNIRSVGDIKKAVFG